MIGDLLRNLQRKDEDVPSPVELMFEELEEALPGNYACRQWDLLMQTSKQKQEIQCLL